MTKKVAVCLEVGIGGIGVFVPECPGCWVFGHSPESALAKVKTTVAEWFDWLERHSEHVPPRQGILKLKLQKFLE